MKHLASINLSVCFTRVSACFITFILLSFVEDENSNICPQFQLSGVMISLLFTVKSQRKGHGALSRTVVQDLLTILKREII